MQRLEVSGVVRLIYKSLGVKVLIMTDTKPSYETLHFWCIRNQVIAKDRRNAYNVINLLKPNTYFTHHQLSHSQISFSPHNTFVCFVWISEQRSFPYTALTNRFL